MWRGTDVKKFEILRISKFLNVNDFHSLQDAIDLEKCYRVYTLYKHDEHVLIKAMIRFLYRVTFIKKLNIKINILEEFKNKNIKFKRVNLNRLVLFNFDVEKLYQYLQSPADKKSEMVCLTKYGVAHNMQSETVKNNYKKSIKEKYGDTNYFKTDTFKQKRKNTLIKNYQTDNWYLSDDFKNRKDEVINKLKNTKLENHGDEKYNNRDKAKSTCLERYGVEYYTQLTDEYNKKSRGTHLKKYGKPFFNNRDKAKITCLEKYGVEEVAQLNFLNYDDLNEEFTKKNFIKDKLFMADDFMKYFGILSPITANAYKVRFDIHEASAGAFAKTQKLIFTCIDVQNKILNYRLNNKELDIYLPDNNLAIEYDGLVFHSEGNSKYAMFANRPKNYHLDKTNLCESNNIQLFHIFEGENIELWKSMIDNKLGLNKKIYARKCIIKELEFNLIREFLDENHLQGSVNTNINLGLFYEDELIQVMTFSKPRFNKNYQYELIRLCTKKFTNVVGGASKLFSYFIKNYNPESIISYANRRFSRGSIYETLGFKFLRVTEPNYFYFKMGKRELHSRVEFQKHKLKNLLENYDPNLTEAENMFNNNYRRIYDCGNLVYEYLK